VQVASSVPEQLPGVLLLATPEFGQRGKSELRLQQRHALALVEVPTEPSHGGTLELRRLIRRIQQNELERFLETEPDLARCRLRDQDIAALDRPLKDRPWISL
jgi:hypothetical protein